MVRKSKETIVPQLRVAIWVERFVMESGRKRSFLGVDNSLFLDESGSYMDICFIIATDHTDLPCALFCMNCISQSKKKQITQGFFKFVTLAYSPQSAPCSRCSCDGQNVDIPRLSHPPFSEKGNKWPYTWIL